jgi:BolA protein
MSGLDQLGERGRRLWDRLVEAVSPAHLEIIDESASHAGKKGLESHFRVVVVAVVFDGKSKVERARMVHALFADELQSGQIHALSSYQLTPAEFAARGGVLPPSPPCAGAQRR